jgi:hypothetical protein
LGGTQNKKANLRIGGEPRIKKQTKKKKETNIFINLKKIKILSRTESHCSHVKEHVPPGGGRIREVVDQRNDSFTMLGLFRSDRLLEVAGRSVSWSLVRENRTSE